MMFAVTTLELTLRMLVALALIGGLLLIATRTAKGRFKLGGPAASIDVRSRHQLTKASAVAVVRAGQRHFLIGVNDNAITLLAEGDDLVSPGETSETGSQGVVDVRAAGAPAPSNSMTARDGARKRRRGKSGPASSRTSVMEALRERTVRRS